MTSSTGVKPPEFFDHPTPQAAGPGRRGGGRARNDVRLTYEQQTGDSQPPAPRSTLRPAEAFQPNSPSCGNQPANISLTAPSSTDTHANSSTLVRPPEAAPAKPYGRRFTMPS